MSMKITLVTIFTLAILTALVWQTDTAKSQVATEGLISYWSFDQATVEGDVVKDIWDENHGTLMGNPKVVEGKVGQALEFDGQTDYVSVENVDSFNFGDSDFSIECWIKVDDDNNSYIINFKDMADNNPHVEFYTNYPSAGNLGAHILDSTGSGFRTTYVSSDVTDSKWYHVVMIYLDAKNVVNLYLDGEITASNRDSNAPIGALENWNWLSIGRSQVGEFMDGIIDEVRIYDRALSDDEIIQNMNAEGLSVNPVEKLVLTWGAVKASK